MNICSRKREEAQNVLSSAAGHFVAEKPGIPEKEG